MVALSLVTRSSPIKPLIAEHPAQCILEVAHTLNKEDALGDDWRRLWPELLDRPLDENVVKSQEEGPTMFTLRTWCRMKSAAEATVGRLITALNAIYRNDLAEIMENSIDVSKAYCTLEWPVA